jgi:hypothetical protein
VLFIISRQSLAEFQSSCGNFPKKSLKLFFFLQNRTGSTNVSHSLTCTHARYAAEDIPTIFYGSGSHFIEQANAHRADEMLPLTDLAEAAQVIENDACGSACI